MNGEGRHWRRVRGLDAKSKFALWSIFGGVMFQCVLLVGLVLGWWS